MSSSDRIEFSNDPGTWDPMDEVMAVQIGISNLNGIPVTIEVIDFQFMGGSMGSIVGEKITRLIEHAANQNNGFSVYGVWIHSQREKSPCVLLLGTRMQKGSLSLMQMAKISSALYDYQFNKKLFYVSILTSLTTGGVTTNFVMLGDIIVAEPNAYIAFAGKRYPKVQAAEYLFHKILFDLIVPRNLLKSVLSELFKLHAFFPLNQKSSKIK
uniref:CoA carboxyltransferase N-terminal domain-containing protein n=1 Tax=Solanum lycopersicum TaxID=4081 RepID=A0A3Q7G2U6_SOLLC